MKQLAMDEATDGSAGASSGGSVTEEHAQANPTAEAQAQDQQQAAPAQQDPDEFADARAAGTPRVAMVSKGADRIPVQLRNKQHLDELVHEHGEAAVEVQP